MRKTLLILLCGFALVSNAQTTLNNIHNQYATWFEEHPQLVPFLQVNQPRYVPGDTVFFKAWLMTADLKPVTGTFVMHMSLVNSAAQEVVHQSVRISNGTSGNQLVLPDSLRGGYYKITLYSNWMKYYGAENFHQRQIEVVTQNRITKVETNTSPVSFYPEGGQLIAGVACKIVMMTNESGEGQLTDDNGKVITTVAIGADKIGFAVFTPEQGRRYTLSLNGRQHALPVPANDGVGILLTPTENRSPVRTVIAVPPGSRFVNSDLQVMLTMHNTVYYTQQVKMTDRNFAMVMIPQVQLPAGLATLYVFSNANDYLTSRNFLVTTPLKTVLKVQPQTTKVAPREKVQVEVSLMDEAGLMVQGDMAVSAISKKVFDATLPDQFREEVLLSAAKFARELTIDRSRNDWYTLLDQHLVASRISKAWMDPALKEKNPSYMNTWLYARGRVVDQTTNEPVADTAMVHLYLQKHPMAYEVKTKSGFIDTYIPMDFWGRDEFFYHVIREGKDMNNAKVEWVNEEIKFVPSARARQTNEPDTYVTFRKQKKLIDQSYSFFRGKEVEVDELLADLNAEIEDEIMGADISVNLDDYIAFNSMDEVIREIIPALQHRKTNKGSIVRVMLINPNLPAVGNPLYIIDGVMTMNTDFFIGMDQKNVHSIKVVHDQYKLRHMGALGRSGVVFVTSKKSVAVAARASSNLLGITGLSRAMTFKPVKHTLNKVETMPDFRSTIYWNPSVKTDNTGKAVITFEASDDDGPIVIQVTGMTEDGRTFSGSAVVEVEFKE